MTASSSTTPAARPPRNFATTRWSLILQARRISDTSARAALEELCRAYWLPVYAFMRRQTRDLHEAQDLTQGLFASLLSKEAFSDVSPERGRFRSYLLAAAQHFASNERDRRTALKRGGSALPESLDYADVENRLAKELGKVPTAEALFERQWAIALLDQVLNRLRKEYESAERGAVFERLSVHLSKQPGTESLTEIAAQMGMTDEAVRVALHRLRKRYRQILREEIAQTTSSADEIDDEIRQLFRFLQTKNP